MTVLLPPWYSYLQGDAVDRKRLSLKTFQALYRLPRMQRHLAAFCRYNSPRKLANLLTIEYELRLRRPVLKGYPYIVTVDLGNVCDYHCAHCPTGQGKRGRPVGFMSVERFARVTQDLVPYLYKIALYNWGEPLMNPHLCSIISYAHQKRVATAVSTNLARLPKEGAEGLVGSGLDDLIVSLNGLSQETYRIYHRGGDFHKVVAHIRAVVEEKGRQQRSSPHIELQFIAMRHNEREIPLLGRFCRELGADSFRVVPMLFNDVVPSPEDATLSRLAEEWLPRNPRYVHPYYRPFVGSSASSGRQEPRSRIPQGSGSCFWLWRSLVINWDGGVAPCCIPFESRDDFGNLETEPFAAIWNNPSFVSSRKAFGKGPRRGLVPATYCTLHCTGWPY